MEKELYNFKELDYILRDTISNIKSQSDYLCLGGHSELSGEELDIFYGKMQAAIQNLYDKLNDNIILKMKHTGKLMNEINDTRLALENERNELKKRNTVIEQDLVFARKIQRQMIPLSGDYPQIGVLYKPMDQLGGDFFDIIRLKKKSEIGVFISDVSGHGISASLLTAMLKSLLMQTSQSLSSPADILGFLNRVMVNFTSDNFITSIFGILDMKKGVFKYSNAGHNSPIIIQSNQISFLNQETKAIPLAILGSDELENTGRSYVNTSIKIPNESKLLLYTDGLTEVIPIDANISPSSNPADFETAKLMEVLRKYSHLPAQEFVNAIYRELEIFRKSDVFEDDICIVCFDFKTSYHQESKD